MLDDICLNLWYSSCGTKNVSRREVLVQSDPLQSHAGVISLKLTLNGNDEATRLTQLQDAMVNAN